MKLIDLYFFGFQGDDSKKGKKKKSADLIELPVDSELPGNSDTDLQRYRDEEVSWTFNAPSFWMISSRFSSLFSSYFSL